MDRSIRSKCALFVMPRGRSAWTGAEALWVTVAGWASAAEKQFGKAYVISTGRIDEPSTIMNHETGRTEPGNKSKWMAFTPIWLITLAKDILLYMRRNRENYKAGPWTTSNVMFVWEQHDLFSGPGYKLASRLRVPFILYVHAPVVWEATKWGVHRPYWGRMLEYFFERKSLRRADFVACVSTEVAAKLINIGVTPEKIIVSPMAIDPQRFAGPIVKPGLRSKFGLESAVVIGWIGSFRRFHGLEQLIMAFVSVLSRRPNARLMLVGDGTERDVIKRLTESLDIGEYVIFTGRVSPDVINSYLSIFDIAVVSAETSDFHYSPLKLREYLAAGRPVLAPRAGEIPMVFQENVHIAMFEVGNPEDMSSKLIDLIDNENLRDKLARAGKERVMETGTWDYELRKFSSSILG